jgi:hypothetical protein
MAVEGYSLSRGFLHMFAGFADGFSGTVTGYVLGDLEAVGIRTDLQI